VLGCRVVSRVREQTDPSLEAIRRELAAHPRMNGYYILKFVSLDGPFAVDDDGALDRLFQYFDDKPWPPLEER
jgi:hypothetical protein